jgi:hypothetical protein
MNFSNSLKILILLVCLQCSPENKTVQEIKLFNTKKTSIRNQVYASALLQNYSSTAVSSTTDIDFNEIAVDFPFSKQEEKQFEETRLALEKEGLLTPEAKFSSVMNSALIVGMPNEKPGSEFDTVESIDLGLPALPKISTEKEKAAKLTSLINSRDNFYRNLALEIPDLSTTELEKLLSNVNASVLVSEQVKEFFYQLPNAEKNLFLESAANCVQLRILVILEMRKRGLTN